MRIIIPYTIVLFLFNFALLENIKLTDLYVYTILFIINMILILQFIKYNKWVKLNIDKDNIYIKEIDNNLIYIKLILCFIMFVNMIYYNILHIKRNKSEKYYDISYRMLIYIIYTKKLTYTLYMYNTCIIKENTKSIKDILDTQANQIIMYITHTSKKYDVKLQV